MRIVTTDLPEVLIVEPDVFRDDRGFFVETYHLPKYAIHGISEAFVQDNHSRSVRGTIRGLHLQVRSPQAKLVRVTYGEIFDVAVDVRRGSPRFGAWVGVVLSADSFRQCYIPAGFAHGFAVTSDAAEVEYKCTNVYDPGGELGIAWNDRTLGIAWPIATPVLSGKDRANLPLESVQDRLPLYSTTNL